MSKAKGAGKKNNKKKGVTWTKGGRSSSNVGCEIANKKRGGSQDHWEGQKHEKEKGDICRGWPINCKTVLGGSTERRQPYNENSGVDQMAVGKSIKGRIKRTWETRQHGQKARRRGVNAGALKRLKGKMEVTQGGVMGRGGKPKKMRRGRLPLKVGKVVKNRSAKSRRG